MTAHAARATAVACLAGVVTTAGSTVLPAALSVVVGVLLSVPLVHRVVPPRRPLAGRRPIS